MDPLIKLPSKKSRNLFVHPENKRPQAPCPVFFSLRTVKNYPLFSGLKTPQSTLTPIIRKKHHFQAPLPIRFSSVHCQKSVIYSYLSYKNAATLVTAFNQGKKNSFRFLPVRILLPLYTAKNHLYYSQNKFLKTSHCKSSVLKQEKTPPSAPCRAVFSLYTLSKNFKLLFFQFKNASTFSSLFAIRKNPHFQAPACTCLFCALLKICLL